MIRTSDFSEVDASYVRAVAGLPPLESGAACVECGKPAVALDVDSWGIQQPMCARDYLAAVEGRP